MKKYLFFDVDGTLYNSKKELPEKTKKAIQLARTNGHEIAIATGRAPFMIESLLNELEINTYVSFNGQYVVLNGEVIYKNGVPNEELAKVIDFAASRNEPVVFLDHQQMIASQANNFAIEESLATLKYPYPKVEANYYEQNPVYQTLLFMNEEGEQKYRAEFPNLQLIRWHPYSCDLLPSIGSKALGIEKIMQHSGIDKNDVVVFGDGLNDVEMLQYVQNSVAMGNGHPLAKAAAKYVVGHVDEDGLYEAMAMLKLI